MKMFVYVAALLAVAVSVRPVLAEQAKPVQKEQTVQQIVPTVDEYDKLMIQMQENMEKMHEQMEKIHNTKNPQERQSLLQKHWATMQNSMGMMHSMWNGGRMGCCMDGQGMRHGMRHGMMSWGKMRGYYSKLTPEQQEQHQYMRDQYMGMQQMMMEHMMDHQYWLNQSSAPNSDK